MTELRPGGPDPGGVLEDGASVHVQVATSVGRRHGEVISEAVFKKYNLKEFEFSSEIDT